ncbi:VOC family protein [Accumulibacter sp.]|uniref:VOC family protein n=1 Tax=Accumulibacter sp. TaxID=2053492 RepID=UPI00261CDB9B|nr:VOC family protein [Accumulibacter sp.]
MPHNPIRWFEIYVQDMDRAKKFYESVLQLKLEKLNAPAGEMWAFPMQKERYGAAGSLVRIDGVASGGNSVLIYFACDDCAIEAARVSEAGGRIEQEKMSINEYGFIVLAVDTEGNTFGLHSMPADAQAGGAC